MLDAPAAQAACCGFDLCHKYILYVRGLAQITHAKGRVTPERRNARRSTGPAGCTIPPIRIAKSTLVFPSRSLRRGTARTQQTRSRDLATRSRSQSSGMSRPRPPSNQRRPFRSRGYPGQNKLTYRIGSCRGSCRDHNACGDAERIPGALRQATTHFCSHHARKMPRGELRAARGDNAHTIRTTRIRRLAPYPRAHAGHAGRELVTVVVDRPAQNIHC